MITLPFKPFSRQLGLVEFYRYDNNMYGRRPYKDANYWLRFEDWLVSTYDITSDIVRDGEGPLSEEGAKTHQVLVFKSEEQKTMFLLTHIPEESNVIMY